MFSGDFNRLQKKKINRLRPVDLFSSSWNSSSLRFSRHRLIFWRSEDPRETISLKLIAPRESSIISLSLLKNACCRSSNAPTRFTIYGLWPDYNDGSWPSCCYQSDFNEKEDYWFDCYGCYCYCSFCSPLCT